MLPVGLMMVFQGRLCQERRLSAGFPFVMRLRENIQIPNTRGRKRDAVNFFRSLRREEFRQLDKRHACGVELTVCGLRCALRQDQTSAV